MASSALTRTAELAVRNGATVVQLRDPTCDDDTFVRLGRELRAVLDGSGAPLIVNDRVHLATPIGADGAHMGQGDLDPREARKMLGMDTVLGLSAQTAKHIANAAQLPTGTIDYLGVGPIYTQTTKPDASAPCGLDGLRALTELSWWLCAAIGGLNATSAPDVRRAGAAGMVVVSAICGQPDVAAATRELRLAWPGIERWP